VSLPQTGERFLPGETGQNRYEHLHRYLVCSKLVRGKDVLDIASGEGYGAAMMARTARHVTGVDISQEAVDHGRRCYYQQNLRFLVGECSAIPLADASVDVVTSFETLEHHDKHDEMMAEVKRVLRPDGRLVISSPNKLVYSDEVGFTNPFHVRELYFDEFSGLCRRYFANVEMYGQMMGAASFLLPLGDGLSNTLVPYGSSMGDARRGLAAPKLPMYFVAVCGNAKATKSSLDSLFFDIEEDFFGQLTRPQYRRVFAVEAPAQLTGGEHEALALAGSRAATDDPESLRSELITSQQTLIAVAAQVSQLHDDLATVRAAYFEAEKKLQSAPSEPVPDPVADDELARRDEMIAALEARLVEADGRAAVLEAEARQRDQMIATLRGQLESEKRATARSVETSIERHRRVNTLNTALARSSSGAQHWQMAASVLSFELAETTQALAAVREQLKAVLSSRSWRLTGALRNAKATIAGRPAG
jgi:SAM-dependent methyltransferase